MLQKAHKTPAGRRSGERSGQQQTGVDLLPALIDRLTQLGFDVSPLFGRRKNIAGGVPLRLSVHEIQQSGHACNGVTSDILTLLKDRTPLMLSLTDLGQNEEAVHNLRRLCEYLQVVVSTHGNCGGTLGMCMSAHRLPLPAFQLLADPICGDGPRYLLLDSRQMTQQHDRDLQTEADRAWSFLWRSRLARAPLLPAYGANVRTACPLLADEAASSILPVAGVQVPPDTAWLPFNLSLPAFAGASGDIRWGQLLPALADGIELAESIFELLRWPQPGQHADAHLNRRLAVSITGLGDLVARCGRNPREFTSLKWLSDVIARIRKTLWHRSGILAKNNGCLPALHDSDPTSAWNDDPRRDDWRRRWQAALEISAVRHRNMLVLSPYSVLPSGISAGGGYTDLLPVIAYADAWSFADAPDFRDWNEPDYVGFHRRAWAVMQQPKTEPLQPGCDLI